ncbi:MAG TPA: hypothetical protein VH763_15775 [Gemmatimonadales bacterium]|jgi:hypothetical protein
MRAAARVEDSVADWLAEGLPDAVAQTTAATLAFPEYDVFQSGGPEKVDSTCAARLQDPHAAQILPFMGAAGAPMALYTPRSPAGRTHLLSLCPFLHQVPGGKDQHGLPGVALPDMREGDIAPVIEARLGRTMAELRADWLAHLPKTPAATGP